MVTSQVNSKNPPMRVRPCSGSETHVRALSLVIAGRVGVVEVTVGVDPAESSQTHPAEILLTRRTGHLITAVHLLHKRERQEEHFQSMHRVIQVQEIHKEQTFAQHMRFQFAESSQFFFKLFHRDFWGRFHLNAKWN